MMQSLLQTAVTTPPCGTPLTLLRVAGPALGRCTAARPNAGSLSARTTRSFPSNQHLTSVRYFSGRYKSRPSQLQGTHAKLKLSETSRSKVISTASASQALRPISSTATRDNILKDQEHADPTANSAEMYTASFAFFEAIWEAGVTHCFVNLGSDHPSIIEAMVKGQREKKGQFPRIITCPNEVCIFQTISDLVHH